MNGKTEKALIADKKMMKKLEMCPPILRDFYFSMKEEDKSYTTMSNYIDHVLLFMNFYTNGRYKRDFYKTVKPADIKRYMSSLKTKEVDGEIVEIGDDIRAARWSSLNAFFGFLEQNDYIDDNPMRKTKRPKIKTEHEVTYLSENEIKDLLDNIKANAEPQFLSRDLCIVSLGIATGLRISAICNINIEDIDFGQNRIRVNEKGNKIRYIPFGDNLKQLINDCLRDREIYYPDAGTNALFVSRNRNRISTRAASDMLKKYVSEVTDKHITPHKLRASCAVNIYDKTKDIMVVKEILGHENIETTMRYSRAAEKSKAEAVAFMDELI